MPSHKKIGERAFRLTRLVFSRLTGELPLALVFTAIIQLSVVLSGIAVARELGAADRGIVALVVALYAIVSTAFCFGVHDSVAYFTARGDAPINWILGTALGCAAGTAALATLAAAVFAPIFLGQTTTPPGTVACATYLAYPLLNHTSLIFVSAAQGLGRSRAWNILRYSVYGVYTLIISCLWAGRHLTVESVLVSMLVAVFACNLLGMCVHWSAIRFGLNFSIPLSVRMFRYGASTHISRLSGIVRDNGDKLLVGILLSPADLGLYVIAATFSQALLLIPGTTSVAIFRRLAAAEHDEHAGNLFRPIFALLLVGLAAMAALLALLAPALTPMLFGHAYIESSSLVPWLLGAGYLAGIRLQFVAFFNARSRVYMAGITDVLNIVLMILGIWLFSTISGKFGVVASVFGAQLLATLVAAVGFFSLYNTQPRNPIHFVWAGAIDCGRKYWLGQPVGSA